MSTDDSVDVVVACEEPLAGLLPSGAVLVSEELVADGCFVSDEFGAGDGCAKSCAPLKNHTPKSQSNPLRTG